jgi:hypothetical protein
VQFISPFKWELSHFAKAHSQSPAYTFYNGENKAQAMCDICTLVISFLHCGPVSLLPGESSWQSFFLWFWTCAMPLLYFSSLYIQSTNLYWASPVVTPGLDAWVRAVNAQQTPVPRSWSIWSLAQVERTWEVTHIACMSSSRNKDHGEDLGSVSRITLSPSPAHPLFQVT